MIIPPIDTVEKTVDEHEEVSKLEETQSEIETAGEQSETEVEEQKSTLEMQTSTQNTIIPEPEEMKVKSKSDTTQPNNNNNKSTVSTDEMRAVWISYLDLDSILKGKSETAYTANMSKAMDNIKKSGFNTVILQVRPFSDAIYPSEYFTWSAYATGVEGKNPGFDPLEIAVKLAKQKGLRIEAWINPYRIKTAQKVSQLPNDHVAKKLYNSGSDAVIEYNGGIYYNPASKDSQNLIVNGVKEIVQNYDIDAIHFDDYFYPTTDKAFDSKYYKTYTNNGGKLSLENWRRENVNTLVKQVYSSIKAIDSSVQFGISPQGNMNNNYNAMFIDVKHWIESGGYIDYIMPQIYFGFENQGQPYTKIVKDWNDLVKGSAVDLCIGLAPYKIGIQDSWAGQGKNEWVNNDDILKKMVEEGRKHSNYGGFALFRYNSVYHPNNNVATQVAKEIANLEGIM